MSTSLFDSIVFGPVSSRRLGTSLGVNLLPTGQKVCSFNCIYCECGWTQSPQSDQLPTRNAVRSSLMAKLKRMRLSGSPLDVITFAGNGEPTLHPNFEDIIDDTITLRNSFYPTASIAVLSNSTYLYKPDVVRALLRVDRNVLKLDSATDATLNALNQPLTPITVASVVEHLGQFNGRFTLQTLFVRGNHAGHWVDNTTPNEVESWVEVVKKLMPKEVMVYTIARATPTDGLSKVPQAELEAIALRVAELGIPVQISG